MRVLIVEEALKTLHGHWFQYISDIVHGGLAAGHEIEVAVHKNACPEILSTLPCQPILTESVFDSSTALKRGGKFGRILHHNKTLFRDLAPLVLEKTIEPYDVVIATTPRLDHLLAYHRLAMCLPKGSRMRFVLLMIESVGSYVRGDGAVPRFSRKTLPLRIAMRATSFLPGGDRTIFATESEGLARQYEKFCGRRMPIVPHVTELPDLFRYRLVETKSDRSVQKLTFGTFGFTRYDKGLDILQSSLRLLLSQNGMLPAARFVIQWTGDYRLTDGTLIEKDNILYGLQNISYIPSFTSSQEYYQWIAKTDIMLLPYRRGFYRDKLSRVAIDAALAGIPIIYPVGTWLEDFVDHHSAGVGFEGGDPKSLSAAIEESITRHRDLKNLAVSRKEKTAACFSAKCFFDKISAMADY